jgi:Undecaprenyl-phosphate glucose phosphotransferase
MKTFALRTSSLTRSGVHALDWLAFAIAGLLTYYWRFSEQSGPVASSYWLLIMQAATVMLLVSAAVYRSWRGGRLPAMLGRVGLAWLGTWMLLMAWLVLTKSAYEYSRIWIVSWMGLSLALLWAERLALFLGMSLLRSNGFNHVSVLLVGKGGLVTSIQQRVKASTWTGYSMLEQVSIDDLPAIAEAAARLAPDEVWICQPAGNPESIHAVLNVLRYSTANIRLIPDLALFELMNQGMSVVLGVPMLDISSSPMSGINLVLKWLEDYVLGALILVLISPVMLFIALAIKLTSPGPVIFKQMRHGWNGEKIEIYKFRTMTVHQEEDGKVTQASPHDSRVTRLGHFLRCSSLDELPQFINVLQGRMSIVGPRPHAVAHNLEYRELIPRYMLRHKVKPGITGWAQITGYRGETDTLDKMEGRVRKDLHYIENWSLWLDVKIIFLTIFKGFFGKNAY